MRALAADDVEAGVAVDGAEDLRLCAVGEDGLLVAQGIDGELLVGLHGLLSGEWLPWRSSALASGG